MVHVDVCSLTIFLLRLSMCPCCVSMLCLHVVSQMQLVEVFGSTKECTGTEKDTAPTAAKAKAAAETEEEKEEAAEEEDQEKAAAAEEAAAPNVAALLAPLDFLAAKYQCPSWFGQPLCSGICIAKFCASPITKCITNHTCRTRLFSMNACMQR